MTVVPSSARSRRPVVTAVVCAVAAGLLASTAGPGRAERIELTDGSVLMGTVFAQSETAAAIRLDIGGLIRVRRAEIRRIGPAVRTGPADAGGGDTTRPAPAVPAAPGAPGAPEAPVVTNSVRPVLRLHGSVAMGERLAPALIGGYLAGRGVDVPAWLDGAQAGETALLVPADAAALPREIEVRSLGSETAFAALRAGAADIGMVGRAATADEIATLLPRGEAAAGRFEVPVALDGIAVIVHPDNPVRALGPEQIAGIFSGEISDWAALGGRPGAILPLLPDERSAVPALLRAAALGARPLAPTLERVASHRALAERVATTTGAVGLVSMASVGQARALDVLRCKVAEPLTPFGVRNGDYPLARRLYFYLRPGPHPAAAEDLLNFARSPAGQAAVAAAGFVSSAVEQDGGVTRRTRRRQLIEDEAADVGLVRGFLKATEGAVRLSVTFRFGDGASAPQAPAEQLAALDAFMTGPAGRGRSLLALGFSAQSDNLQQAVALSERRARDVATLLEERHLKPALIAGFGPLAQPCGDPSGLRPDGRRVEIWMR